MKVPLKILVMIVTRQISSSLNTSSYNGTYLRGLTTVKRNKKLITRSVKICSKQRNKQMDEFFFKKA